jgi:DNA-binding transcriptional MerR regulator
VSQQVVTGFLAFRSLDGTVEYSFQLLEGQASGGMMQIGELAGATGVAAKTIRFYEGVGLLPPAERAANGYRQYGAQDVRRLRFIRGARELDFSLEELKAVLALRESGEAPCGQVLALLDEKLFSLEAQLRRLVEMKRELAHLKQVGATLPTDDVQMERCVCQLIRARQATM